MGHSARTFKASLALGLSIWMVGVAVAVEPAKTFPVVPLPFWPFGKPDRTVAMNQIPAQPVGRNAGPAATPVTSNPTQPGVPDPLAEPAVLASRALAAYEAIDGCIMRFIRRENLGKGMQPEETVLLKMRREPFAVHMKWLDTEAQGRQLLYNRASDQNNMQVITAPGDIPLIGGNRRMKLDINNSMARNSTRYTIVDTGYGGAVLRYKKNIEDWQRGALPQTNVKGLGLVNRPEFTARQAGVELTFPAGYDTHFPRGARRLICFSMETGLPTILTTWDENGQELEYYRFDRCFPVPLDEADFDADRLWLPATSKLQAK